MNKSRQMTWACLAYIPHTKPSCNNNMWAYLVVITVDKELHIRFQGLIEPVMKRWPFYNGHRVSMAIIVSIIDVLHFNPNFSWKLPFHVLHRENELLSSCPSSVSSLHCQHKSARISTETVFLWSWNILVCTLLYHWRSYLNNRGYRHRKFYLVQWSSTRYIENLWASADAKVRNVALQAASCELHRKEAERGHHERQPGLRFLVKSIL